MNASFNKIKPLLLCLFMALLAAPGARADERTAGTMPVSKKHEAVKEQETDTTEKTESADTASQKKIRPAPPDLKSSAAKATPYDIAEIESLGLISNVSDGGLGIDMWEDSEKSSVVQLISEFSAPTGYPVMDSLVRRALLTRNEVDLMTGRSEAGRDLLTARIEKLTDMGFFEDAVKLYSKNPGAPYHERLGQAGIMAMLYNGQIAYACLEARAHQKRFASSSFWQEVLPACDYMMSKLGEEKKAVAAEQTSEILQKVALKEGFRYKIKALNDVSALNPIDKVVLVADSRLDYSSLKINPPFDAQDSFTAALLLKDKDLPDELRFALLLELVKNGLRDPKELAALYKDTKIAGAKSDELEYRKVKGWKRLPYLYQTASLRLDQESVDNILKLNEEYGFYALFPFSDILQKASPENLSTESIRLVMLLFAGTNTKAPAAWEAAWKNTSKNEAPDLLLLLAYGLGSDFSTGIIANFENFSLDPEKPDSAHANQLLLLAKEKLDKSKKLHNYTDGKAYEKNLDLTLDSGYVMPSDSLIDSLKKARDNRRLGEVVLLSAIALREVPPAKLYAGSLREVVDGLKTVGLTDEARELTKEVALGLSEKK